MIETNKIVVKVMVDLMCAGYVLPVLTFVDKIAPQMDKAIVRFFVMRLAHMASPPFSDAFAKAMTRLLLNQATERTIRDATFTNEQRTSIAELVDGLAKQVLAPADHDKLEALRKAIAPSKK
jgi:hypothetical protein